MLCYYRKSNKNGAFFLIFFAFFDDFVDFFVFEGAFASFQDPSGAFDGFGECLSANFKKGGVLAAF